MSTPDPIYCPRNCGRRYTGTYRKITLNEHLKYVCGVPKQFECKVCFKRFARKSYLRNHCIIVHLALLDKWIVLPNIYNVCNIDQIYYWNVTFFIRTYSICFNMLYSSLHDASVWNRLNGNENNNYGILYEYTETKPLNNIRVCVQITVKRRSLNFATLFAHVRKFCPDNILPGIYVRAGDWWCSYCYSPNSSILCTISQNCRVTTKRTLQLLFRIPLKWDSCIMFKVPQHTYQIRFIIQEIADLTTKELHGEIASALSLGTWM